MSTCLRPSIPARKQFRMTLHAGTGTTYSDPRIANLPSETCIILPYLALRYSRKEKLQRAPRQ